MSTCFKPKGSPARVKIALWKPLPKESKVLICSWFRMWGFLHPHHSSQVLPLQPRVHPLGSLAWLLPESLLPAASIARLLLWLGASAYKTLSDPLLLPQACQSLLAPGSSGHFILELPISLFQGLEKVSHPWAPSLHKQKWRSGLLRVASCPNAGILSNIEGLLKLLMLQYCHCKIRIIK